MLVLLALAAPCPAQFLIDLAGPWRITLSDDPAFSRPDFDDHTWSESQLPRTHRIYGRLNASGWFWQRRTVAIPLSVDAGRLALTLGPIAEVYEIYLNGVRVGSVGEHRLSAARVVRPRTWTIPAGVLSPGATATIAIRMWAPAYKAQAEYLAPLGIPDEGPYVLTYAANAPANAGEFSMARREKAALADLILGEFYLIVAVLVGLACFADRQRRDLAWMFGYLVFEAARQLGNYLSLLADAPYQIGNITWPLVSLGQACLAFFASEIAGFRSRWRYVLFGIPVLLHVVMNTFVFVRDRDFVDVWVLVRVVGAFMALSTLAAVIIVVLAIRKATGRMRLLLLTTAAAVFLRATVLTFANPLESLNSRFLIGGVVWTAYDFAAALLTITIIGLLISRFTADRREKHRLAAEMEAARMVQRAMLHPPEASGIEAAYLPALEVGGDFYQVLDNGRLIVAGDVSGKGLKAAMVVSLLTGALRNRHSDSPAKLLNELNQTAVSALDSGFVTAVIARIETDRIVVANAGHPAPYCDGAELSVDAGLPLGIDAGAVYDEREYPRSGQITFVSDGVVEAASPRGELFGFERTAAISRRSAGEIAEAARAWGQNDDITVVTVRRAMA